MRDIKRIAVPGDQEATIDFAVRHFIETANQAIAAHGFFAVALSGGSTPKRIFEKLSSPENRELVDYTKVLLFWSDERDVPLDDPESNYKMALDAGFASLPLLKNNIFPMKGNSSLREDADQYEKLLKDKLFQGKFDLVMLGMGDDGHTASLFPHTAALHVKNRLVVANEVPQKHTTRLSLTYPCINEAREIAVYILGQSKAEMVNNIFNSPVDIENFPIQGIGTKKHPALFILDTAAAALIT